nr:phage major tail tube protein [Pedobacter sp. ASV19]
MGIVINKVINSNIYVDGANWIGKADEVNLPVLKSKTASHSPLGLIGELDYSSGMEKMEAKIKWNSYYKEAIKKFSNFYQAVKIQVRFSIDQYEDGSRTGQLPGIAYLTVRPNDSPGGQFKAKDNVELESNLSCSYYKLEIDGEDIVEYDAEANIYIVDGVDLLAQYRANLGV